MHRIYSHQNPAMVEMARNELHARGIDTIVRGEHTAALLGGGSAIDAWVELWVMDEGRLEEASEIVQEFIDTEDVDAEEAWTCEACGERIEGQFAACWNCGAARAA
jgi:hypothetical protein